MTKTNSIKKGKTNSQVLKWHEIYGILSDIKTLSIFFRKSHEYYKRYDIRYLIIQITLKLSFIIRNKNLKNQGSRNMILESTK